MNRYSSGCTLVSVVTLCLASSAAGGCDGNDDASHAMTGGAGSALGSGGAGGRSGTGGTSAGRTGAEGGTSLVSRGGNGSAGSDASSSDAGAAGAAGNAEPGVRHRTGRVVDFYTRRPLADLTVVVGATLSGPNTRSTQTHADGGFEFDLVGSYQAVVIDPDGASISFYDGLEVNEPLLVHYTARSSQPPQSLATLQGQLSGGAGFPLASRNQMVVVHLLTPQGNSREYLGGGDPPFGPDYSLPYGFDGESLPAKLFALGTFADDGPATGSYSAAAVLQDVLLENGKVITQDLRLADVPLGRVSGQVNVPSGWEFTETQEEYRFALPDAKVGFPLAPTTRTNPSSNAGAFEYELPDLRSFGAELCVAAVAEGTDGKGRLWSEACGLALDAEPITLEFAAAPTLLEPPDAGSFASGTRLAWSSKGSRSAPNLLELEPSDPSPASPRIRIFSTTDTTTFPSLAEWGVKLTHAHVYQARAIALSTRDGDDAFGVRGLGAISPAEWRMSYSNDFSLSVEP